LSYNVLNFTKKPCHLITGFFVYFILTATAGFRRPARTMVSQPLKSMVL